MGIDRRAQGIASSESGLTKTLLDLQERIETAKGQVAEEKGALGALMERLHETFGLNSIKEAEAEIQRLNKINQTAQKKLDEDLLELEAKYNGLI